MFFWNSLAFSMIQQMLAVWSLVPLPFLNASWTSGSSRFTYCWSLAWRILSITLPACEWVQLCGSLSILWHNPHKVFFQADDISHDMIYMDQGREEKDQIQGRILHVVLTIYWTCLESISRVFQYIILSKFLYWVWYHKSKFFAKWTLAKNISYEICILKTKSHFTRNVLTRVTLCRLRLDL